MICTNPECEMFGKELRFRGIMVKGGEEYFYCIYCDERIDMSKQVVTDSNGPYIKNKKWLKEWKHINTGRHSGDIKQKPNLEY